MNATHLKLGRKLGWKSNGIGNGIIYMVRRDSSKKPCRPKITGRENPVSMSTQRAQEERARLAFAKTSSTYPGLQFVIILRTFDEF